MTSPPSVDPAVSRVLDERPEQRFVGDRDLTAWPTAAGCGLVRLAARARQRLTPHVVLLVALAIGFVLAAGLTTLAGTVYDAVTEDDGVAALDRPVLDTVIGLRTPVRNTLVAAYSSLGGAVGMPLIATVVAVGLTVAWRQVDTGAAHRRDRRRIAGPHRRRQGRRGTCPTTPARRGAPLRAQRLVPQRPPPQRGRARRHRRLPAPTPPAPRATPPRSGARSCTCAGSSAWGRSGSPRS
jgi:hypothetical protein